MVSALYYSDTFGNRPSPGVRGRIYEATDTGALYVDTGSVWLDLAQISDIATQGYTPTNEGTERIVRTVIAGTARAFSRPNYIMPYTNFQVRRAQVILNDSPSGVDGSNHFKVKVTDGTTSIEVPIDSDGSFVHEDDLATSNIRMGFSGNGNNIENSRDGVGMKWNLTTEVTIDTIEAVTGNANVTMGTTTAAGYLTDSGQNTLAVSAFEDFVPSVSQTVRRSFSEPITIGPGTYHIGIRVNDTGSGNMWWAASGGSSVNGNELGTSHAGNHNYPKWITEPKTMVYPAFDGPCAIRAVELSYPEFSNKEVTVSVEEVGTAPADPGADIELTLVVREI